MKVRLDLQLIDRGLVESRSKASALVMAGAVLVDGKKIDKPGQVLEEDVSIEILELTPKYVSRGGLKLEKGIENFAIDLKDKICMDVGASTGGFTDCMLQYGAAKVYAVDVGYGQLDWKLRQDERVICMERANIRYTRPQDIADKLDFVCVDVAFISLTKVLAPIKALLKDNAQLVCLIKPQFEADRRKVGKNGVARGRQVHFEVISTVLEHASSVGFEVCKLDFSPIKGPKGNIEYLLHLKNLVQSYVFGDNLVNIMEVVEKAHKVL